MLKLPEPPRLTRPRICGAFAVALAVDAAQLLLGPLGWAFFDEAMDVAAMAALSVLIGFHPLFLPTFVVEVVPLVDMLPTWTGCVALVVALRKKEQAARPPTADPSRADPASEPDSKVIDI